MATVLVCLLDSERYSGARDSAADFLLKCAPPAFGRGGARGRAALHGGRRLLLPCTTHQPAQCLLPAVAAGREGASGRGACARRCWWRRARAVRAARAVAASRQLKNKEHRGLAVRCLVLLITSLLVRFGKVRSLPPCPPPAAPPAACALAAPPSLRLTHVPTSPHHQRQPELVSAAPLPGAPRNDCVRSPRRLSAHPCWRRRRPCPGQSSSSCWTRWCGAPRARATPTACSPPRARAC